MNADDEVRGAPRGICCTGLPLLVMDIDPKRVWRVPAGADLRYRVWEGEYVVFQGAAGDTHRLSEAAARVLLQLIAAPATEDCLVAFLDETYDCTRAESAETLSEILQQLELIECVEACP